MLDGTYTGKIDPGILKTQPVSNGIRLLATSHGDDVSDRFEITSGAGSERKGYAIPTDGKPQHWLYYAYGTEFVIDHALTYAEVVRLAQAIDRTGR